MSFDCLQQADWGHWEKEAEDSSGRCSVECRVRPCGSFSALPSSSPRVLLFLPEKKKQKKKRTDHAAALVEISQGEADTRR